MSLYHSVIKPVFFKMDPEKIHDRILTLGQFLGSNFLTRNLTKLILYYEDSSLNQKILNIDFPNPIGLAAGFDKDARLTKILPVVGFGHIEVGSITGEPCDGNPKPRVWRIPEKESLVIHYGLKNKGAEYLSKHFKKSSIPTGISIAKTNCKTTVDTNEGINDYFKAYSLMKDFADYITINISCPNAFGGEPFTDSKKLELLFQKIFSVPKTCPIFLKLSPDMSKEELDNLFNLSKNYQVDGFICSNLTKNRPDGFDKGGISGKLVKEVSDKQLIYLYKKNLEENTNFVLMGCGGIFTAEDVYEKIKNGASLVQLITGMIYEGPQLIGRLNKQLAILLKKDGYSNISEAVGANFKQPDEPIELASEKTEEHIVETVDEEAHKEEKKKKAKKTRKKVSRIKKNDDYL